MLLQLTTRFVSHFISVQRNSSPRAIFVYPANRFQSRESVTSAFTLREIGLCCESKKKKTNFFAILPFLCSTCTQWVNKPVFIYAAVRLFSSECPRKPNPVNADAARQPEISPKVSERYQHLAVTLISRCDSCLQHPGRGRAFQRKRSLRHQSVSNSANESHLTVGFRTPL